METWGLSVCIIFVPRLALLGVVYGGRISIVLFSANTSKTVCLHFMIVSISVRTRRPNSTLHDDDDIHRCHSTGGGRFAVGVAHGYAVRWSGSVNATLITRRHTLSHTHTRAHMKHPLYYASVYTCWTMKLRRQLGIMCSDLWFTFCSLNQAPIVDSN